VARKPRDYAAENRRRNQLAKDKGFSSYSQMRRGLEKGRLKRSGPSRVVATFTENLAQDNKRLPVWQRSGASSPEEYMKMKAETKAYLKKHSGPGRSKSSKEDMKQPEIMGSYYRAYVKKQKDAGSLKHYLVDVTGHVSEAEWKKKYAKRFKK
jgi:hypothetical protein